MPACTAAAPTVKLDGDGPHARLGSRPTHPHRRAARARGVAGLRPGARSAAADRRATGLDPGPPRRPLHRLVRGQAVPVPRGRPAGYDVDLLAKAARLTGLRFEYVASRDLDDALRRLAAGEIEPVPLMRIDDGRRGRVPLTQPVANFTLGIFTRTDAPYVDGPADLAGRRVAMPRGTAQSLRFDDPVPVLESFDSAVDGSGACSTAASTRSSRRSRSHGTGSVGSARTRPGCRRRCR
jgi:ABC-type amino acid transport substrate-binding protein